MLWTRTVLTVFSHNKIRACGLTSTYEDNRIQYLKLALSWKAPNLGITRLPWELENLRPRESEGRSPLSQAPRACLLIWEKDPWLPEHPGIPETSNILEDVLLLNTLADLLEDWILSGKRRSGVKGTGRPPRCFMMLLTAAWAPSFLLTLPCSSHPSPPPPAISLPWPQPTVPLITWLWPKVATVIEEWIGTGLCWTYTLGSFLCGPIHVGVWYNIFLATWGLRFWGSFFLHCSPGFWDMSRTTVL